VSKNPEVFLGSKKEKTLKTKSRKALFFNQKTKYIKEVLLCKPTHFEVNYVINPWMKPGSVDKGLALTQWQSLVNSLNGLGIKVNTIEQEKGLPDMVFAADQAIIKGKEAVLSNFRYKERRKEKLFYKNWFEKRDFKLKSLPNDVYCEGGGESLWLKDKLLIGSGFRTSKNTKNLLQKILNIDVHEIELINPMFYHLDTCLFPLNDQVLFYYPPAFSKKSVSLLKKLAQKLIPLDKKEAFNFAANSLPTDHHVITQKGNRKFIDTLKEMKYKVVELDLSEFTKAGGGIHCLVSTIKEEYA